MKGEDHIADKGFPWFYGISVIAIGVYVIARAVLLSFTIDEAMSFNYVSGLWTDVEFANNHFLNTQLMILMNAVFGSSEWSLRLPNVLAFFLYAWAVFGILKWQKGWETKYVGSVLLLLSPFLLEFFGIARGYGLSIAFELAGMSALYRYLITGKEKRSLLLISAGFTAFGLLSNSAVLNVALMQWGVIFALYGQRWKVNFSRTELLCTLAALGVTSLSLYQSLGQLFRLRAAGELFFGSDNYPSFGDQILSLFFYSESSFPWIKSIALLLVLALVSLFLVVVVLSKKVNVLFILSSVLLFGSTVGWVLEFELFESLLPRTRTALIYLPLLLLWLVSMIEEIHNGGLPWKKVGFTLTMALGFVWIVNFAQLANFSVARDWSQSSRMKEIMTRVDQLSSDLPRLTTIEKVADYRSTINYYIFSRGMNVQVDMKAGVSWRSDFVLADEHTLERGIPSNYEVILDYRDVGPILLVRISDH